MQQWLAMLPNSVAPKTTAVQAQEPQNRGSPEATKIVHVPRTAPNCLALPLQMRR